jgi:hypothetical protein
LLLVFALALLLRVWHLSLSLPALLHPDEDSKVRVILRLLSGQAPDYLQHPGLLVNSATLACALAKACGAPMDMPTVIYIGRLLVAVLGALTVFAAAWVARELWPGPRQRLRGLLAGALLAGMPLHVLHSRYLKEDIHLTLCVLLCVGAVLQAWRMEDAAPRRRWWLLAGAFAGGCFAAKYVGMAMVPMVALALLWREGLRGWRGLIAMACLAGLTFAAASPQMLWQLDIARRDLGVEVRHGVLGEYGELLPHLHPADRGLFYFTHALNWGLGWAIILTGFCGLVLALNARPGAARRWFVLAVLVWYLIPEATSIKRQAGVERYALPLATLLAIGAVGVVRSMREERRIPQALTWAGSALLVGGLIWNAATSVALVQGHGSDTRETAVAWLMGHLPPGPVTILQPGLPEHALSPEQVRGVHWNTPRTLTRLTEEFTSNAQVLILSDLCVRRFEAYPELSTKEMQVLRRIREEFPYVARFEAAAWRRRLLHNPTLELRSRRPWPTDQSLLNR